MFRAILMTQWKWSRLVLMPSVVVAFALPILSVQGSAFTAATIDPSAILQQLEGWSVWYAVVAAGVGLLMATSAWSSDHRGMHVYALSLPVSRARYVLLRFGAGGVLLLAPIVGLWTGALLAVISVPVPTGLDVYPTALAARFGIAVLVAYSVFFAISSGTSRTAGYILAGIGSIVAAHVLLNATGLSVPLIQETFGHMADWPGPFQVFTGRWMLIDV